LSILHLDDDEEVREIFKAALLQVAPLARLSYIKTFPPFLGTIKPLVIRLSLLF
jgi:hypothetical protein